jgi:hypothetical protein
MKSVQNLLSGWCLAHFLPDINVFKWSRIHLLSDDDVGQSHLRKMNRPRVRSAAPNTTGVSAASEYIGVAGANLPR